MDIHTYIYSLLCMLCINMSTVEKSNKNKGGDNVTRAEQKDDRRRQPKQTQTRGSELIHKRSSISLDWCARRGLLSSQSLRRLSSERKREEKRQMKEKVKTRDKKLVKKKPLKHSSQPSQLGQIDALGGSSKLEASLVRKEENMKTPHHEDVSDTTSTEERDDDVSLDIQHVIGRKNGVNNGNVHRKGILASSSGGDLEQNPAVHGEQAVISSVENDVEKTSSLQTRFQQKQLSSSSAMTKTMNQAHNHRESSLIPVGAKQDASWFAERGLMSRKSYVQYQKEKEKIDSKSRPKPLIDVDDLSLSSNISGLDENLEDNQTMDKKLLKEKPLKHSSQPSQLPANPGQNDSLGSSKLEASLVSKEENMKTPHEDVSDTASTDEERDDDVSLDIHHVVGRQMGVNMSIIPCQSRPKPLIDVDDLSLSSDISGLDENLEDNQMTIQVPDNFIDVSNMSSIGFNYFAQSKSLQQHWAKYGGGGDGDEEDNEDSTTDEDYEVSINPSRSEEDGTSYRRTRKQSILRKQKSTMSTGTASKRVSFNSPLMNKAIEMKKRTSLAQSELSELTYQSKPLLAEDDKKVNPPSPETLSSLKMGLDNLLNPQVGIDKEERDQALAQVIQSVLESNTERGNLTFFSPDEVNVLHKMVRKLSSQDFTNDNDDRKLNDDSSYCDSTPERGLKDSFSSHNTLITDNTSFKTSSQASMLAKVAKDMSVSLERSKSHRLKRQCSSEDSMTKYDTFEYSQNNEQSQSTKLPDARGASQVVAKEKNDTRSTKPDKSDDCAKSDESANTKSALEALIRDEDSSFMSPDSIISSSLHQPSITSSVLCLVPPSETDSKVLSNCEEGQRKRSETHARKTSARKSKSSTPNTDSSEDILTMGINYISVTMLVNIYGMLREMSMLGHASIRLQDFDVNSHQRNSRMKGLKRLNLLKPEEKKKGYLETTLTAGYIVRTALDEYEMFESSPHLEIGALSQLKKASMEYDATMARDFKALVAESLSDHFDGQCFQKGSVMRELVDSGLEIVWISDRHPNDIHYCICVNRDESRVIVVFRRDETVIRRIQNSKMMEYDNPLSGVLQSTKIIKLRAAVSKDILTPRLDTNHSIVEEIQHKVKRIQKELNNGDEFHVTICGHAEGGGLAIVTAFYLASSNDLKLSSPIQVVTFASPRVGDKNFQRSFQHLEDSGRILYARFANSNDMISIHPFWALNGSWKFEDWYKVSVRFRGKSYSLHKLSHPFTSNSIVIARWVAHLLRHTKYSGIRNQIQTSKYDDR